MWTEVFGCGPIAPPVVNSYLAHHSAPITVYGMPDDLAYVPDHPLVRKVAPSKATDGSDAKEVLARYRRGGHAGTAHLWAGLIRSNPDSCLVHVDADQVFVGNAVDDVVDAIQGGATIAGPRRPYRHNENGRTDLVDMPDTVATFCTGFRSSSVPKRPRWWLERAISGRRVNSRPALDFFDPVTQAVVRRRGSIAYLDSPSAGTSSRVNDESAFLQKILQMPSAAATGCSLAARGITDDLSTYQSHALASWAFFARELLSAQQVPDVCESERIEPTPRLARQLASLDRSRWVLR